VPPVIGDLTAFHPFEQFGGVSWPRDSDILAGHPI
jgi:hypothetical protein